MLVGEPVDVQVQPGSRLEQQPRLDGARHLAPQYRVLREILDANVQGMRLVDQPAHFSAVHFLDAQVHRTATTIKDHVFGMIAAGDDNLVPERRRERRRHQAELGREVLGRERRRFQLVGGQGRRRVGIISGDREAALTVDARDRCLECLDARLHQRVVAQPAQRERVDRLGELVGCTVAKTQLEQRTAALDVVVRRDQQGVELRRLAIIEHVDTLRRADGAIPCDVRRTGNQQQRDDHTGDRCHGNTAPWGREPARCSLAGPGEHLGI